MLSFFSFNCRNQQFMRQMLRKSITPFCFSDQNLRKNISELISYREKLFRNQDEDQSPKYIQQHEEQLDSFLAKFMVHGKVPYELFRRDLVKLSYKTYPIKIALLEKYLDSAMKGDYMNCYKDEMTRKVFLAELYGILSITNYQDEREDNAQKSLTLWQNVIEKLCSFYTQWKKNKSFDIDAFTKNKEIVYFYEQYLESHVAILRLSYQKGDFEQSKTYFEAAKTKIEEAIQIVSYFETQINYMKGQQKENQKQFIEPYKDKFFKLLVDSNIIQIKILIWERNFKLGQKQFDEIEQRQIANEYQKCLLKMVKYELMKFSTNNYQFFDQQQIKFQFVQEIKQMDFDERVNYLDQDMIQLLDDKYAFLMKYEGNLEMNTFYEDILKKIAVSYAEVLRHFLEKHALSNSFQEFFELSVASTNYLSKNGHRTHYFWDFVLFSQLLSSYRNKIQYKNLKPNLEVIESSKENLVDSPIEYIFDFFQLIVDFEETSQINKINNELLQKIKQTEFDQYYIKYLKQLAIEQMSLNFNLHKELEECYQNQITLLCQHEGIHKEALEKLYRKLKQIKQQL